MCCPRSPQKSLISSQKSPTSLQKSPILYLHTRALLFCPRSAFCTKQSLSLWMSHIWMSHVTHMNESCHTYEWLMSHIWMSHVAHMNESGHTCEWVMSLIVAPPHAHTHALSYTHLLTRTFLPIYLLIHPPTHPHIHLFTHPPIQTKSCKSLSANAKNDLLTCER